MILENVREFEKMFHEMKRKRKHKKDNETKLKKENKKQKILVWEVSKTFQKPEK